MTTYVARIAAAAILAAALLLLGAAGSETVRVPVYTDALHDVAVLHAGDRLGLIVPTETIGRDWRIELRIVSYVGEPQSILTLRDAATGTVLDHGTAVGALGVVRFEGVAIDTHLAAQPGAAMIEVYATHLGEWRIATHAYPVAAMRPAATVRHVVGAAAGCAVQ